MRPAHGAQASWPRWPSHSVARRKSVSDPRVDSLLNDAMRLRLSRRSIMRRGAALGLSTAAVGGVLSSAGRASAAPRAAAFLQERQLNVLQASYFVPAGEDFFDQAAQ